MYSAVGFCPDPLGSLQLRSPRPLAGFVQPTSKGITGEGNEEKGRQGEKRMGEREG